MTTNYLRIYVGLRILVAFMFGLLVLIGLWLMGFAMRYFPHGTAVTLMYALSGLALFWLECANLIKFMGDNAQKLKRRNKFDTGHPILS